MLVAYEGRQYMPCADWSRREGLHRNRAYTLIHAGVVRYVTAQQANMTQYYIDVECKAPPLIPNVGERNVRYEEIRRSIGHAFVGHLTVLQAVGV